MKLIINGEKKKISANTIEDLLKKLKIKNVAVEYNGNIVYSDQYKKIKLKNNDRLEIVRFVGGG